MSFVKSTFAVLAVAAAAVTGTTSARAEAPKLTLSPNVGFTTDYIFRGFSQTARSLTGFGGIDATYGIFYAGVWASGLRFGQLDDGRNWARLETDIYAGIKPVLGPVTFDLGFIYYAYPGSKTGTIGGGFPAEKLDYVEAKAGASVTPWKDGTVGVTAFYSPEYTNQQGGVTTVEGSFAQVLPGFGPVVPTFSALIGYQKGSDDRFKILTGNGASSYTYYNVGVNFALWEKASIDFRYWDTNISNTANFCSGQFFQCDGRFVGTFKVQF